jgi:integrase
MRFPRAVAGKLPITAIAEKWNPPPMLADQVDGLLVLTELEFRDQLLVFLDAGLGTRRGELGALRWMDCDFNNRAFDIQHSYYWRRGGHLIDTKSEASAQSLPMHPGLKDGLLEWRSQSLYNQPEDFVFASERLKGRKPLDLAAVLKKKIQPVQEDWHYRRGLAYISAHSGNDASGDGRRPTHDPRLLAAQQPPRHEQVPAGDVKDQASGTRQVGRCLLACRLAAQTNKRTWSNR